MIDIDTWKLVQHRLDNKMHRGRRMDTGKDVALFAGILKCADCSSNLSHTAKVTQNNTVGYYRCSRYLNNGKTACTIHSIKESVVEQYKDIKQLTRAIVCLLIDHIEIGCVPEQADGVQEIKNYYRFIGNLLNEK